MAKGGNSARSKKSHSSKPYDVSNSFVRKVASRVTSFIPQSSWLSKWFVSSNEDDKANSDDQDSDTETVSEYRSSKRPKIDLQRSFPVNSFRVAPASDNEALVAERPETESRYSPQRITDDPVPGPSGLNKQQIKLNAVASAGLTTDGISSVREHRNIRPRPSLSTYLNQSTVSSGSVDRKINGDDVSESSESTSGCSSLPHHVAHQTSVNNSASNTKRNFDNTTPTNRRRLLLLNRTRSPRMNTPLNRRRSLFNVSAFGSPSLESDTSLSRSAVINSPFYAGRTGYGGASAYRRSHDFTPELHISRRSSIEVQPVNSGSSSKSSDMAAMSQTTRRILEALEQFASPVQDAKKMMIDSPSLPALASKRSRFDPPVTEQKSSLRQLTIPTVPDIIKLRRREKLQDSLESARLIATSTKDSSYQLRSKDDSRSGKVLGRKTNIEEEETVKEVNLPSIALPITVLPKFDIEVPPQFSPPPTSAGALKFATPFTIQDFSRTASSEKPFMFSEPLSVSENCFDTVSLSTDKSRYPVMDIPLKPKMDTNLSDSNVKETRFFGSVTSGSGSSQQASLFSVDHKVKSAPPQTKVAEGEKGDSGPSRNVPETSPKNGEVLHSLGTPSGSGKNVSLTTSWGSILKTADDTWECGTCLIRNKPSASRCIACTEPRELPQKSSSYSHSMEQLKSSSSKELDKSSKLEQAEEKTLLQDESKKVSNDVTKPIKTTWECATCWIKNPETLSKCQACETSKPKEKTGTSTVIGKFLKPTDTWECPTCMIRNKNEAQKCAACEELKPGSAVAKSTLKFNVDIPAEASKFTFGINKSQTTALSDSAPKGFSFGKTEAVAVASGFTFGMGDNGKSNFQNTNTEKKAVFTFGIPPPVEIKTNASAVGKASGDGVCKSDDNIAKLAATKESNESLSEKQGKIVKVTQKSDLPYADAKNQEKSSDVSLAGHLSGGCDKQSSESAVVNFKFLMPSSSSESISTVSPSLFSFGTKAVSNAAVRTSSEDNGGTVSTNEASDSEKKSIKPSQIESAHEVTSKSEKDASIFGASQASAKSVHVTTANTVFTNKEHLTKLVEGPQTNSVSCLPINIPNKTQDSGSSVSILQKPVGIVASAASVPVSVSQISSSGTALAFSATNTVQQIFGTSVAATSVSVAPVNFSVPLTTQNFGSVTSSVQHSGAVTTSDTSSVGVGTASTSSFTSVPITTTPQFGSSAALSFSTPTTATTNFSSDKPVLNFGTAATATSESNGGTSVFANASTVSASGNTALFGNQKSLQQRFGTPVSTVSTFSTNSAQNFGASATNLSGFGAPSTTSQQFGVPATTPAFPLTTPAFGATSTQNFGNVTTPAPSFSSSVSGTFTTKPTIDTGSKGSAPLVFSSNTSLPSLPFSFGSTQNSATDASGPAVKPPNFSFGASNTSSPAGQSSGFGFGNFGSNSATSSSGGQAIFGPGTAPAFGASGNTGFTGSPFFGQNLQTNNNVFGFTSSQGANGAQASQNATSGFNFSSTQPAGPPTFNPNAKPSFNFTGGNTPTFTAEANSPAPAQRRIKKAVRRTQARANAL
ncbi:nuclear pore complex protein Nup153 [Schistocerca serialis cubense]|uniref:nuclear pore complex protein Nup153 n=1 Tax=Schistocerca serialis cubense TaxID=2023355 RepID=UPI00214ED680|nr:nuclear pore complex protein Nup153 [Schistocerca serialis cubense]